MKRTLALYAAGVAVTASLSGCVGERPVAGTKLSVTDFAAAPGRNRVFFSSNDQANLAVPAPGSNGDPTMHGGFVAVRNPESGEFDAYPLPAENWTSEPAPEAGYRYLDVMHKQGPCEYVRVTANDRLVASCRGEGIEFSLDEDAQGTLAVDLILGMAGGTRYCAVFGGHVMRDVSRGQGRVANFLAVDAPVPSSCQMP